MRGAMQLVKVAGIAVRVHWTFGLLILWVIYASLAAGVGLGGTVLSVSIVGIVFLCVVLHEYGHALTARRYGVKTRDIILSPIGGIARLEYIPEKPLQEIVIAIAGPAVNLIIATVLLLIAAFATPYWVDLTSPQFWGWNYAQPLIIIIAKINLILLVFNLTPAFPMDGGRVLRAALAIPYGRLRATVFAGRLGQAIGMMLLAAGMFEVVFGRPVYLGGVRISDLILSIIGVFVFLAARREIKAVRLKHLVRTTPVGNIVEQPAFVSADHRISDGDLDVPEDGGLLVTSDGTVVGILFREFYDEARSQAIVGAQVGNYTSDLMEPVMSDMPIDKVIDLYNERGYRVCPVYEGDRLLGVVTRKRITEFLEESR